MTHTYEPTRDPSQDKRPTHIESEWLETNIPSKWTGRKRVKERRTQVQRR